MASTLCWILLAVIWGSTWLFVRIGLRDLPPFTFAGLRFVLAALVLFGWLGARHGRLPHVPREDWRIVIRTGLVAFALTYALTFWGAQFITGGTAAVVFSTMPLFTMALAHRDVAGERLTPRKLGGAVLGIAGVGLIFSDQLRAGSRDAALGSLAILASALTMARAQVDVKARAHHLDPTTLATWQLLIGGMTLFVAGAAIEGSPLSLRWTSGAVWSLLYLSVIASSLAWFLYYWMMKQVTVTVMSTITLAQPLVTISLGWLFMGETMGWVMIVGAVAIVSGLGLIIRPAPAAVPTAVTARAGGPAQRV